MASMDEDQEYIEFKFTPLENTIGAPKLVCFPHGAPIEQGTNELAPDLKFQMFAHKNPHNLPHLAVKAETSFANYVGKNYGADASKKQMAKFAVAVVNTKKAAAQVVEIDHVFSMEQHVKGLASAQQADASLTREERGTKKRNLIEAFGSKKKKRQLRSALANQVDLSNQEAIGSVANSLAAQPSAAAPQDDEEKALEETRLLLLPPFNRETDVVEEIYELQNVVPEEVWEMIDHTPVMKLSKMADDAKELISWPSVVVMRAKTLSGAVKSTQQRLCRALLYLAFLIRFFNKPRYNKSARDDFVVAAPEPVFQHLLNNFAQKITETGPGGKQIVKFTETASLAAKLKCHIMVMSVIAFDFSLDPSAIAALAADLKIDVKECNAFLREVGCVATGPGKAKCMDLKAPVRFPPAKKRGKGG